MKIKIFTTDYDGRISFTQEELQKLLDEVYREGYNDAKPYYQYPTWTYTTPAVTNNPNITWTTTSLCSTSNLTADNSATYAPANSVLTAGKSNAPEPGSYQIKVVKSQNLESAESGPAAEAC